MVDDQSGFSVDLLHDRPYVLTLAGEHEATAAGDHAVLVASSVGSCVGAAFYASQGQGGVLASDLSVTVRLSGAETEYALCLAHAPFGGGGTSAADGDFDHHPHVTARVRFEPPSVPPSPPPPTTPPVLPPPSPPPPTPSPPPPTPSPPPPTLSPPLLPPLSSIPLLNPPLDLGNTTNSTNNVTTGDTSPPFLVNAALLNPTRGLVSSVTLIINFSEPVIGGGANGEIAASDISLRFFPFEVRLLSVTPLQPASARRQLKAASPADSLNHIFGTSSAIFLLELGTEDNQGHEIGVDSITVFPQAGKIADLAGLVALRTGVIAVGWPSRQDLDQSFDIEAGVATGADPTLVIASILLLLLASCYLLVVWRRASRYASF